MLLHIADPLCFIGIYTTRKAFAINIIILLPYAPREVGKLDFAMAILFRLWSQQFVLTPLFTQ